MSFFNGLVYEHLPNDIHRLALFDAQASTIDKTADMLMSIDQLSALTRGRVRYLLVVEDVPFNPYMLYRLRDVTRVTPNNLISRIAVVSDPFTTQVFSRLILPRLPRRVQQSVAFFMDEDDALVWLTQKCPLNESQPGDLHQGAYDNEYAKS